MDLADNQERVAEMGRRARCMLERHFLQRHALETWRTVLRRLPARGQET
jgi:hypothetical protein